MAEQVDVHTHRFYKTENLTYTMMYHFTIQPSKQNLKKCNRRIDESQSLKSYIHINEDTHRNGSPHAARHNRHIISIKQCKNRRIIIEGSRYIIIYRCIDTKNVHIHEEWNITLPESLSYVNNNRSSRLHDNLGRSTGCAKVYNVLSLVDRKGDSKR